MTAEFRQRKGNDCDERPIDRAACCRSCVGMPDWQSQQCQFRRAADWRQADPEHSSDAFGLGVEGQRAGAGQAGTPSPIPNIVGNDETAATTAANVEGFRAKSGIDPRSIPNNDLRWVRHRAEPQTMTEASTSCCTPVAAVLAVLLLLGQPVAAVTYIVDQRHPQASDQNAGTAEAPFKTIGKAAGLVAAGDAVTLRTGVYREAVVIEKGGTTDKPIRFQPDVAANVVVTGAGVLTKLCVEASVRDLLWEAKGSACIRAASGSATPPTRRSRRRSWCGGNRSQVTRGWTTGNQELDCTFFRYLVTRPYTRLSQGAEKAPWRIHAARSPTVPVRVLRARSPVHCRSWSRPETRLDGNGSSRCTSPPYGRMCTVCSSRPRNADSVAEGHGRVVRGLPV